MKVAVFQMDAGEVGPQDRQASIEAAVAEAAEEGCRIIVLPELAISGYGAGGEIVDAAGDVSGEQVNWLKKLAREAGCALVAGLALQTAGKTCNSALFVPPDGGVVRYDKIHLYGNYEKTLFTSGRSPSPILSFEGMTFGLLVCFDVEFPERVRDLALRGAEAILVPTALPKSEGGAFIARSVLPVRAFENQVFIAYANHVGEDARFAYQGQSCIAAPDGKLLARGTPDTARLLVADLDPTAYDACRAQNPYLEEVKRCSGFLS
ncbi:MAG: hydrolase [Roseibium sp.]|uniref:nitrilase-related carbon-nitrogen hydrolase n=1 Tax=Roseibium sp. TaxID=1936156 RepID=UPI00260AC032|nr:nitrilase-related carbon-nitrogen hydrolase [Roseibium sp.]MCV0425715.1 hydrolase [Roseibium sp.]